MPEFLDLAHRFSLLLIDDEQRRREFNRLLIGPPRITRPSTVDPRAGFTPPPWWRGDEYASRSAIAATVTLKHRR